MCRVTVFEQNFFNRAVSIFGGTFSKYSKLNGTDYAGAILYEGMCGHKVNGNQSTFGFDPGEATRYFRNHLVCIFI